MPSDANAPIPKPPTRDLWHLPKISSLDIQRVRYHTARRHVIRGRVVEFHEGIEILIWTDEEIPIRALSPALYVGKVELAENEHIADRNYRFFALEEELLRDNAPISLGWVGTPGRRARTKFRYHAPRRTTER